MIPNELTFAAAISELRIPAAVAEWKRAKAASRCAKGAPTRKARRAAYSVKYRSASHAILLAPDRVRIGDARRLHEGILGLHFEGCGGLHFPVRNLTLPAALVVLKLIGFALPDVALAERS